MSIENSSEVSEAIDTTDSSAEATTEACDSDTELYDNADNSEANDELYKNEDSDSETELVEDEGEKHEAVEESEIEDIKTTDNPKLTEGQKQEIRREINEKSEYSNEVNEKISSVEELEVYQDSNLREEKVDGRTCLVRDNIDLTYVDPKTGKTNLKLMQMGRAPYDAETGEKIELHHIGQDYDSPLAEVTEDSEHGAYYSVLHTKEGESWRNDPRKNNNYNKIQRPGHWKSRSQSLKGGY